MISDKYNSSTLINLINGFKKDLINQAKENPTSIICVVFICILLVNLIAQIKLESDRISLATAYLTFDYLILIAMVFSRYYPDNKNINPNHRILANIKRWFNQHNTSISVVIAFSLIPIIEATHRIRLTNNMTIALSYSLLFFWVIVLMKSKLKDKTHNFNLKNQKIYFVYAFCIALSFFFSTTVDDRDRYGTHFQLVILSWLMLLHLVISWVIGQWKLVKQLKNERVSAELMHLKSQVNPHFLFNTLNNLYGLAREKSDETPALILKLSDMLRYTIYQGKKDRVLLSQEVDYLNDFIQLQQVRYHKKVEINFNHQVNNDGLLISPLLLIILLENSYKHGVEKLTQNAFVNIALRFEKQHITFEISNNFDPQELSDTPGIGLKNLQRRLSLIYPHSHSLQFNQENNIYSVRLEIELEQMEAISV